VHQRNFAEIIVVMGRNPRAGDQRDRREMDFAGGAGRAACRFMLRALGNAVLRFTDVKVPKENLIGREGEGSRSRWATLNTRSPRAAPGVVAPAGGCWRSAAHGATSACNGGPVGRHEAVAQKLAGMAATTFARGGRHGPGRPPLRPENGTTSGWKPPRRRNSAPSGPGARGRRHADPRGAGLRDRASQASRGEPPAGVERAMRDSRIKPDLRRSTEIMHLFIAREAVDRHFQVPEPWWIPRPRKEKLRLFSGILAFYACGIPRGSSLVALAEIRESEDWPPTCASPSG